MKKIIAVLSLAILLCSVFSGMASAEGEIVAAKSEKVVTIEGKDCGFPTPFVHYYKGSGYVRMSFIFDTLTWKDKHDVIPWLADSWSKSSDAKTWTFSLHRGVKWNDGELFTADDVKFTFDYMKQHLPVWYWEEAKEELMNIDHVDILNPYTVRIHLKESRPAFIEDFAGWVPIIPEHIWKDVTNPYTFGGKDAVVGTGPLKLVKYDGTQGYYEYEANEKCFKGKPLIDKLISMYVGDVKHVVLALKTGDIDAAHFLGKDIDAVEEFKGDPDFEIKEGKNWWVLNLYFNCVSEDEDKNPMKITDFRRAIAYGINRKDIVENVTHDGSRLANTGLMHPDSKWYKPDLPDYEYDPAKANEILDNLGFKVKNTNDDKIREYPEGGDLKFTLYTTKDFVREAEFIKKDLEGIGIKIEVESVVNIMETLLSEDFRIAIRGHGGIVNPRILRSVARGTACSEKYDEKYAQQRTEIDEDERKKLVGDLQTIIAEELPVYALYHPRIWHVYNPEKLDTWFYTKDALAGSIPLQHNKLAFFFDPWRYDVNDDRTIEKSEVIDAIRDYYDDVITKKQVIDVITLYFL